MSKKGKRNNSTIPKGFRWKWSLQSISFTIQNIILAYTTYYCTNSLGLAAGVTGIILMIAKFTDGFTDIIAAVLIERVHSRFGKGRVFLLLMPVSWALTILMFTIQPAGTVGKAFFIFFTYFLICSVCNTLVNTAEPIYLARALPNPGDSAAVLSSSNLIMTTASIAYSVVFPFMISGLGSKPYGWSMIALISGIPCVILSLTRFFTIKERIDVGKTDAEKVERFGFRDAWEVIMTNKPVLMLVLVLVIANLNSGNANLTYYFQYIIGDINLASVPVVMTMIGMIPLVFAEKALKKFSAKQILLFGAICGVIGSAMRSIPNVPVWCVASALAGFAALPPVILIQSMLIDYMDIHEYKTGKRVEGVFGAMNAFPVKVGAGLGSALMGVILGTAGFDGNLAVQTQTANNAIVFATAWLPAILCAIQFLTMLLYKNNINMDEIRAELRMRRAKLNKKEEK